MTMLEPRPERARSTGTRRAGTWARVPVGSTSWLSAVAALAGLVRLAFVGLPLSPDEAGFLLVARQWGPGTSLYGQYWVDRPPFLIELFGLAAHLGGAVGVRLLGCAAAAATTLLVALTARRLVGRRGAAWTAVVAALALSSPGAGALPVNGELLAAPFVAAAVWCWTGAWQGSGRAARLNAAGAGAAAVLAVLVKQNMLDGVLFIAAATLLGCVAGHRERALRVARGCPAGAAAALAAVLGTAVAHGSSLRGIWFAMYPFRLQAARVQETSWQARWGALVRLAELGLVTLGPVVLVALALLALRRRRSQSLVLRVVAPALTLVAAYDVVSVVLGGSYWTHYLVQLAVPTSLASGIVVARLVPRGDHLVLLSVVASALVWVVGVGYIPGDAAVPVGRSVAAVARPDDTLVSVLGGPNLVLASGLRSDYEYLWSLPARTLDPGLGKLEALLEGPRAPTWLVVRGRGTRSLLLRSQAAVAVRGRYRVVARICSRLVYLRDGLTRGMPPRPATCRG